MADFRKMTVEGLRELARKVLGPGHSRLKTKGDLVAALEAAEKQPAKGAAKAKTAPATAEPAAPARPSAAAATKAPPARPPAAKAGKAAKAAAPAEKSAKPARAQAAAKGAKPDRGAEGVQKVVKAVKAASRAAGKAASDGARAAARAGKAAAEVVEGVRDAVKAERTRPAKGKLASAAATVAGVAAGVAAAARVGGTRRRAAKEAGGSAADPAGFFVARVRGEDAVRDAPHPMTETAEEQAPEPNGVEPAAAASDGGYEERLGELPWGYGDDAFMALPRDPRTLFLYWDLSLDTVRGAFEGLDHPRAQLKVLARTDSGWEEVRSLEFALESRGYYVHDLEPGRVYRAEIHAVGRRGEDRVLGRASNEMMLPPLGPSPVIDDRFIRIPWDLPLGRLLGPGHAGGPFSDEARALLARLSDWSRFALRGGGGSAGGIGGRSGSAWPTSPAPTSPGGPFGGREGT